MMAKKALLFKDIESLKKIMNSNSPKEQKFYGRQVMGFDPKNGNRFVKNMFTRPTMLNSLKINLCLMN